MFLQYKELEHALKHLEEQKDEASKKVDQADQDIMHITEEVFAADQKRQSLRNQTATVRPGSETSWCSALVHMFCAARRSCCQPPHLT